MEPKSRRGKLEVWFDKHNHKMEFLRTVFGFIAAIGGICGIAVFLKIFGFLGD